MSSPADRLSAALAGRYRIERELGAGGMATVYLAHDEKHDRKVAIKVLKPELAAVLGADRFVVEIKTTASLSHPHILPLFDSGTADGFLFYVMPYIQGETIREKLNRETQFGVDEAVRIAREVADALDYAHRHGVIHRDIKPENILLHDGRAMVMDFGIALAVSAAAGGRMTETGLSLGTPHYMSPEQATAEKEITPRSDVYSLASVLYEMLAGQPPHVGGAAQQIIMKIITEQAQPVRELRKNVPENVEATLAKALEKLPADRFESAARFGEALGNESFTGTTAAARRGRIAATRRRDPLFLTVALVAVIAVALAAWLGFRPRAGTSEGEVRFDIALSNAMRGGNIAAWTEVAVSPDGRMLAFIGSSDVAGTRLFLRRIDDVEPHPVAGTDGAQVPIFSPDGEFVAYWSGGALYKVAVAGGQPVQLATMASPLGATWSSSGVIIVCLSGGLYTLPASGGEPKLWIGLNAVEGAAYISAPIALPDGKTVLFGGQGAGGITRVKIGMARLGESTATALPLLGLVPLGARDGMLVFVNSTAAVVGVAFDPSRGTVRGEPTPLGINVRLRPNGAADAALSASGTLVFESQSATAELGLVDFSGRYAPLVKEPRGYSYPRFAPDGKRIAMAIGPGGRNDIWIHDLRTATTMRLTSDGTSNERPEWTPDGTRVLYRSDRGKRSAIWWEPADHSAAATPLVSSDSNDYYEGVVSPDGKSVVFQLDNSGDEQANILARSVAGGEMSPVAATKYIEVQPRISPDGKWITFLSDASGASEVVVQPFPGPGPRVQVSDGNGSEPVWGRDGKHLYYRNGRKFIAVTYAASPTFSVLSRNELFDDTYVFAAAPHANYDVAPDGQHLLVVKGSEASRMTVAVNWWRGALARLAAAKK